MPLRRKPVSILKKARKASAYRRRLRCYRRSKSGYLKIIRKCPEFWLQNTTIAGTPRLGWISGGTEVAYTGTVASLGTPTAGMNGTFDVPFACKFALSDVINYLDIATLADKYRIKSVYIRVIPNFTMNGVQSLFSYPSIQYVIDDDDANTSTTTVAQLREKMGVVTKTFKPGQYVGIKIRWPKIQATVQDSTGTANAEMKGGQWLNSSNVNIPHFALKGVISNMDLPVTGTAKISFKFDCAYVIEAKDFQ